MGWSLSSLVHGPPCLFPRSWLPSFESKHATWQLDPSEWSASCDHCGGSNSLATKTDLPWSEDPHILLSRTLPECCPGLCPFQLPVVHGCGSTAGWAATVDHSNWSCLVETSISSRTCVIDLWIWWSLRFGNDMV